MELEYDHDKDARNLAKHDVSLAEASRLEWEPLLAWEDRLNHHNPEQLP